MEPRRAYQAEVSRRLKAARWLNGGLDAKDRPAKLSVRELAKSPVLVENRISENRIEEIEQMRTMVRAVELSALAEALGLPAWFDGVGGSKPERVGKLWQQALDAAARERRRAEEEAREEPDDTDHLGEAGEGGRS